MRFWIGNSRGGSLVSADEAKIPVTDHGFTVADGVFETLKVMNGVPFALSRHIARLHRSAEGMGLVLPSDDLIYAAVADVKRDIESPLERMRITVTSGSGPLGSERGAHDATLVLVCGPMATWPASASVAVVPWQKFERSALTGLKTTAYADNVVALNYARGKGADEAIFANSQGMLCEAASSNVFLVLDGELITPTLASGALGGITRALTIEWCDVTERDVTMSDFYRASEVMLSSSTRDLQPVHKIITGADHEIVLPAPGPVSASAMLRFASAAASNLNP